jgi:RNA polymerase sigma factor (sigma-70 family)
MSRSEQNALLLQIYDLAHRVAREWIPAQRRDDVVHDFSLRCLERLRAGEWTAPICSLERYIELQLIGRKANFRRNRRRTARRDAGYLDVMTEAPREWMSQELETEERRLRAFTDRVRDSLPKKAVNAHALHRDDGLSYREVAKKLRVSSNDVHRYMKQVHERFREMLPTLGIEPPLSHRGGRLPKALRSPARYKAARASKEPPIAAEGVPITVKAPSMVEKAPQ